MLRNRPLILILAMVVSSGVIALSGCAPVEEPRGPVATNSESGKIPVTTASEEARKEFLHGRDLSEKLLIQDSIQYFDRAIALDPNFAIAELNRANVSPTGKEFFEHLKKAVALSDKASNGERLLILGNEAGANGDAAKPGNAQIDSPGTHGCSVAGLSVHPCAGLVAARLPKVHMETHKTARRGLVHLGPTVLPTVANSALGLDSAPGFMSRARNPFISRRARRVGDGQKIKWSAERRP